MRVHLGQHRDPRTGDAQGGVTQLFFRGHCSTEPLNLESVKKTQAGFAAVSATGQPGFDPRPLVAQTPWPALDAL
jgi:hypothetical protein